MNGDQTTRIVGRGTALTPPNRFESVRHETDWEQLAADDELLATARRVPTVFLPDNAEVLVGKGQKLKAGQSAIARWGPAT